MTDKRSWRIPFSNVYTQTKHAARYYHHWGTTAFMIWIHGMCFLAPKYYSPVLAAVTVPMTIIFGLGIEMVFHRMLCHKSFSSPKWWEYTMAYFGILNIQVSRFCCSSKALWLALLYTHAKILLLCLHTGRPRRPMPVWALLFCSAVSVLCMPC